MWTLASMIVLWYLYFQQFHFIGIRKRMVIPVRLYNTAACLSGTWGDLHLQEPWWRHQMKTFSALLTFCAGNGIHRPLVNSQHKDQWSGALAFSLIYAWINGWVNNREAGDLRRHRPHYDVSVMPCDFISHLGWYLISKIIYQVTNLRNSSWKSYVELCRELCDCWIAHKAKFQHRK